MRYITCPKCKKRESLFRYRQVRTPHPKIPFLTNLTNRCPHCNCHPKSANPEYLKIVGYVGVIWILIFAGMFINAEIKMISKLMYFLFFVVPSTVFLMVVLSNKKFNQLTYEDDDVM